MGLRRSTTSITRRSAASANTTTAWGGKGSRGTGRGTGRWGYSPRKPAVRPPEGKGDGRGVRRCSAAGDGGGHAVIPTGGGSQSMIGDVNDAGSSEIRDAVNGVLQRSVRQRRHLLESRRPIHDPTDLGHSGRRMHPSCAVAEPADNLHGGLLTAKKRQRGIAPQW
jgi:hypothetical protein